MKFIKFMISIFIIGTMLSSCQTADVNLTENDEGNVNVDERSKATLNDFFNYYYVHDELSLDVTRESTYEYIDDLRATTEINFEDNKNFQELFQANIFPCWYCGESEYFTHHNFYVPFYNLNTRLLDGIYISQTIEDESRGMYFSVDLINHLDEMYNSDFSNYWIQIKEYYTGKIGGKEKSNFFKSKRQACTNSTSTGMCVCEGDGQPCPDPDSEGYECLAYCSAIGSDTEDWATFDWVIFILWNNPPAFDNGWNEGSSGPGGGFGSNSGSDSEFYATLLGELVTTLQDLDCLLNLDAVEEILEDLNNQFPNMDFNTNVGYVYNSSVSSISSYDGITWAEAQQTAGIGTLALSISNSIEFLDLTEQLEVIAHLSNYDCSESIYDSLLEEYAEENGFNFRFLDLLLDESECLIVPEPISGPKLDEECINDIIIDNLNLGEKFGLTEDEIEYVKDNASFGPDQAYVIPLPEKLDWEASSTDLKISQLYWGLSYVNYYTKQNKLDLKTYELTDFFTNVTGTSDWFDEGLIDMSLLGANGRKIDGESVYIDDIKLEVVELWDDTSFYPGGITLNGNFGQTQHYFPYHESTSWGNSIITFFVQDSDYEYFYINLVH